MVVLGSTGSIGKTSLNLAHKFNIGIEAISCNSNYELLNEQILKFNPKFVCINDENLAKFVKHKQVFTGEQGILDMLEACKSKLVINSLVGFAGLAPSVKIQNLGKKLALANKESLVVGGKFLNAKEINPIDSEHFGLKFLLENKTPAGSLIITASGGAFYKTPIKALKNVTAKDALKHPNWDMGAKITIDSATMANKLFEVLEAFWLFGTDRLDALIEPTSMIHALVAFKDGSTMAHLSRTDMSLAIAHAVLGDLNASNADQKNKKFSQNITANLDLLALKNIKFHKINLNKYPIFSLKDELLANPDLGVIVNAANEIGVFKFLKNECEFLEISRVVLKSVKEFGNTKIASLNELFEIDKEVRIWASKEIKERV
ncbi:1-deoxy-D-xylulose-5-phosphate reductoisomerase [Campylobacter sp. CCUG 57310]|uniref:1-deoxy-D-xylulose-5-phosphate reductoisomerase n=1 Tax=Campylobacter sp. CCUG 57310 TaxID=2517362 RepID=UPI001563F821|nr:1-deoxy-D-xylulose-5-phosphate reductoisomerase [Campylobacter sp. CCUG 57310]QKF91390.1 1-deoxy-D-xylulose 5-phosphate reductoisomerase [Campylobacter sp. CCUG 57310]